MREWLGPIAKYVLFAAFAVAIVDQALATQHATRRILRHRRELEQQIAHLRQRNAQGQRVLKALASDPFYVEQVLRERYGYVRPGEERRPLSSRRTQFAELPRQVARR
jgi:cell division protein FtsB